MKKTSANAKKAQLSRAEVERRLMMNDITHAGKEIKRKRRVMKAGRAGTPADQVEQADARKVLATVRDPGIVMMRFCQNCGVDPYRIWDVYRGKRQVTVSEWLRLRIGLEGLARAAQRLDGTPEAFLDLVRDLPLSWRVALGLERRDYFRLYGWVHARTRPTPAWCWMAERLARYLAKIDPGPRPDTLR